MDLIPLNKKSEYEHTEHVVMGHTVWSSMPVMDPKVLYGDRVSLVCVLFLHTGNGTQPYLEIQQMHRHT